MDNFYKYRDIFLKSIKDEREKNFYAEFFGSVEIEIRDYLEENKLLKEGKVEKAFEETIEGYFSKLPQDKKNIKGYIEAASYAKMVFEYSKLGYDQEKSKEKADHYFYDNPLYIKGSAKKIEFNGKNADYCGFGVKSGNISVWSLNEIKTYFDYLRNDIKEYNKPFIRLLDDIWCIASESDNRILDKLIYGGANNVKIVQKPLDSLSVEVEKAEAERKLDSAAKSKMDSNEGYRLLLGQFDSLLEDFKKNAPEQYKNNFDIELKLFRQSFIEFCFSVFRKSDNPESIMSGLKADTMYYWGESSNKNLKDFCESLEYAKFVNFLTAENLSGKNTADDEEKFKIKCREKARNHFYKDPKFVIGLPCVFFGNEGDVRMHNSFINDVYDIRNAVSDELQQYILGNNRILEPNSGKQKVPEEDGNIKIIIKQVPLNGRSN